MEINNMDIFSEILNNTHLDGELTSIKVDISSDGLLVSITKYGQTIPIGTNFNIDIFNSNKVNVYNIEIGNNHDGYKQNISCVNNEIITNEITPEYNNGKYKYCGSNYVKITWNQNYKENYYRIYMNHILNAAFLTNLTVTFNDIEFTQYDYLKSKFTEDELKTSLCYKNDIFELIAFDTHNNGRQISYCNNLLTENGGTHVNAAYSSILKLIKYQIDPNGEFYLSHKNIEDIKNHCTVIIKYNCLNPVFNNSRLITPVYDIKIQHFECINEWKITKLYENLTKKKIISYI